jgi:hypothetical protein
VSSVKVCVLLKWIYVRLPPPPSCSLAVLLHAISRRRALVDVALGVPVGAHPWFSIDGAALVDFVPVLATSATAIALPLSIPLDMPAPDPALSAAIATPLWSCNRSLNAVAATVSFVLSQRWTAFHLPHRKALLCLRTRSRLLRYYGLAASGFPVLSTSAAEGADVQNSAPAATGSKNSSSSPSPASRKGAATANASAALSATAVGRDESANITALYDVVGIDLSPSVSSDSGVTLADGTAPLAPLALTRALSMLSAACHPGVPYSIQVRYSLL